MVLEAFSHIFNGRGYWRTAPFAELAELYAARFLRHVAQGMVGIMVAIFLYQNGYNLVVIMLFIAFYYLVRTISSFFFAYYVAWVGPKRATLVSNILTIPALISLTSIDKYTGLAVTLFFIFQALSLSLFTIASDMHFSSIKSNHHAGKEIGWLSNMEKIAAGIAPMIGGFIAYWLGPESTMWIAALLSVFAALPLFMTPEKIRRKQKIIYRGLPWRKISGQLVSHVVAGADQIVSGVTWAVFVGVIIFGVNDNSIYAKLGILFSISLLVAIVSAHLYGLIIDRRRGDTLFRAGVVVNAIVHSIRPFIATPISVALLNSANEVGTSAYLMPFARGVYDTADNLPGYRVAYISMMMVFFCAGATLLALVTAGLIWQFGERSGLSYSFVLMSLLTLLMLRHNSLSLRG